MKGYKTTKMLLLIAVAVSVVSCGSNTNDGKKKQAQGSYKTMTVELSESEISNQYSAAIRGEQFVEIRPQVSGAITAIKIDEGATIKKGEALFIIDPIPYEAALATALANVASAKASVATAEIREKSRKTLLAEKVVSEMEYTEANNNLLVARAKLEQAKAQEIKARNDLSYTVVKSPVAGVAGMINYRIGALVSSNITSPLVSVSSDAKMHVYFSIPETQKLSLIRQYGSKEELLKHMPEVELQLNDGSIYEHKGQVDAISGIVDKQTGSVSVRASFKNPEQMLSDGGNGLVIMKTKRSNVVVIPKIATYELQNKVFVYKVVEGKAVSTEIDVFPMNDGKKYIVEKGIEKGDMIIAEGAGLVKEGTVVNSKPNKK